MVNSTQQLDLIKIDSSYQLSVLKFNLIASCKWKTCQNNLVMFSQITDNKTI